jgi:WhiB family transcriptional regulator, redox-sensing transcriptional regulator
VFAQWIAELNEEVSDATEVDWARARCRDGAASLTSLFFSEQLDDIARAKAICGQCEVIEPCFRGALERREPWGVWGGQLFANGKVLAFKRKRGRPPKNQPVQLTA